MLHHNSDASYYSNREYGPPQKNEQTDIYTGQKRCQGDSGGGGGGMKGRGEENWVYEIKLINFSSLFEKLERWSILEAKRASIEF